MDEKMKHMEAEIKVHKIDILYALDKYEFLVS